MKTMTSHERFTRIFNHQEADRVPMLGAPWGSTLERWVREGMPEGVNFNEYFGLDEAPAIFIDISPRYPERVVEETDDYIIKFDAWGTTSKNWKHASSTPHFMERTIKDRASWEAAKARMIMTPDRVDWAYLEKNYADWRKRGCWIRAFPWFGYDITHACIVGTETLLIWMAEDPELVIDIFNTELDCSLQLMEMILQRGYTFDLFCWCDDMGYRNGAFFSVDMYREILKPAQKRAIDWAHSKGIKTHLHSCGNINSLVPELLDMGLDALNPLEVKAGMDPLHLKKTYGDKLVLHGGINAMLWDNLPKIEAEIKRLLPTLKQGGGYIFQEDHSIPDSVSLEGYRHILDVARKLGSYQ